LGAAFTALLFTIGKFAIGLYLGKSNVGTTFGAAGSLAILLIWVYYSSQILFFGAEFTQVYANKFGSRVVPVEYAVPLSEEDRNEQGIPRKESLVQMSTRSK
jgi:membrane protein